jgi:putative endonuclease
LQAATSVPEDRRIRIGKIGEDLACAELQRCGYAILARRYRTRAGELDIIAQDGPTIVFVEVKARRSIEFGGPAAAVTAQKRRKVCAMATDYLGRRRVGADTPCRFDVVAVSLSPEGKATVEIYKNAFGVT